MTTFGQFLASFTYNLLFFSNDVQTTAIAVAVTGSLCCSIAYAIVHLVTKLHCQLQPDTGKSTDCILINKENLTINHIKSQLQRFSKSACYSSNKGINYCKRCYHETFDRLCQNGTCSLCCQVQSCPVHYAFTKLCDIKPIGPKYVDLSKNCIEDVPDRLGFIGSQLTFLNLSNNKIKTLPEDIGLLIGLQDLHIHNNLLTTIPVSLGSLPTLCELDLRNNHISHIPDSLWQLPGLKYLYLDNNDLKVLSPKIGLLTSLQHLSFGYNHIEHISASIGNLLYLQVLSLHNNPISLLPDTVCALIHLEELNVANCCLLKLPKNIGSCKCLQKLVINNNRTDELPHSISQLRLLTELYVCNNNINMFPSSMENMKLLVLEVDGNPLVTCDTKKEFSFKLNNFVMSKCPPLMELSARRVFEFNQKLIQMLPKSMQAMLNNVVKCNSCWRPIFQHRMFDIKMGPVGKYPKIVPLLLTYCSQYCQLKNQ